MIGAVDSAERLRGQRRAPVVTWSARLRRWNPPLHNQRFWATQALVLLIAVIHTTVEAFELVSWLGQVYFLPISLFFIPVVYAALYFGLAGAIATAVWCTLLSVPNWVLLHHGSESLGAMMQMAIIGGMGVFVGNRADQQMQARADAEAAWRAGQESEARYRGLFETSGEGVLILDDANKVVDANAAAERLFQGNTEKLVGRQLDGPFATSRLPTPRSDPGNGQAIPLPGVDGTQLWVEPVETSLGAPGGLRQVVLRDVTGQTRRRLGLETYAAHVVKAQEEERQRIAQELHDDTVQSLVLLWRTVNEIAQAPALATTALRPTILEARDMAGDIAESVRGYARGLRPPVLDDLGLAPAIRRLASEFTGRSGTPATFRVSGHDRRLSADAELALFRIAQESLRNVEKHASARRLRLVLHYRVGCTILSVTDDGSGFDVSAHDDADSRNQLGLVGMQERARMAGGALWIRSRAGAGTTVTARIPDPAEVGLQSGPNPASEVGGPAVA